jgi:CheY-like chemotaxis protein
MSREIPSVLVLEPNALQCDLIKAVLSRCLMNPIICPGPEQLRELLGEHLPDVLLIDTYLPGQNGLDLIGQLQAEACLPHTKVLFLSSLGYPEIVQKAARLGASGFLIKPLNPDLLVTRIWQCFTRPAKLLS